MEVPSSWGVEADTRISVTCCDEAAKITTDDGTEGHKDFSVPCESATVKCKYCVATLKLGVSKRTGLLVDISKADSKLRQKIREGLAASGKLFYIGLLMLVVAGGFIIFAGSWLLNEFGLVNAPEYVSRVGGWGIVIGVIGFMLGIAGLSGTITGLAEKSILSDGDLREDRLYLVGEDFYPEVANDKRSRPIVSGLSIGIIDTINARPHAVSLGSNAVFAFQNQNARLAIDSLYADQNIPSNVIDCMDENPVYSHAAHATAQRIRNAG